MTRFLRNNLKSLTLPKAMEGTVLTGIAYGMDGEENKKVRMEA